MKKIMLFITLGLLLFWMSDTHAQEQEKKDLYFELNKDEISYKKIIYNRTVTIETTRKSTGYGFLIRCECHIDGSLSFLGHNNPEVGEVSEPPKVISDSAYKKLEFISFDALVKLLKQHDLLFNDIYNLYLVEPHEKEKGKYTVYNVKFINSFIDNQ